MADKHTKRSGPDDERRARMRKVVVHLLLRTLFWVAVAVTLFFYFKSTGH